MPEINFWHLYDAYEPSDSNTRRRVDFARMRWAEIYRLHKKANVIPRAFVPGDAGRRRYDVKANKPVPFCKDVFEHGWSVRAWTVYTNADVAMVPEGIDILAEALAERPCFYSFRVDFKCLTQAKRLADLPEGNGYPGADLFAFNAAWWHDVGSTMPDLLMGYEGWDFVMKKLMERSGFDPHKYSPIIYHEEHEAYWKRHLLDDPGQIYNRTLAGAWARDNGYGDEIGRRPPFLF